MKLAETDHFLNLKLSYASVGDRTWEENDFSKDSIITSRTLFTEHSLIQRKPVPKDLEVYAFLSGIEFPDYVTSKLLDLQSSISSIIGDSLHYWVLPENFGLEYAVFKWPEEVWDESRETVVCDFLSNMKILPFYYFLHGIQVNPDGCIVAKGYDEGGAIFSMRELFRNKLSFLPKKQSGWAHIPLGRILEPVGEKKFEELRLLINEVGQTFITEHLITSAKFVHETKWYMERKAVISQVNF